MQAQEWDHGRKCRPVLQTLLLKEPCGSKSWMAKDRSSAPRRMTPHAPLGVQITGVPGGQADASALPLLCQGALPHPTGWGFYPLDHWPPKLTRPRPSLIVPTAHTGLIHSLSSEHLRGPSFPPPPQNEQRNFQNPHSGDIR